MTVVRPPSNPWLSIWLRPRATIRSLLDTDPEQQVILLAVLNGIVTTFHYGHTYDVGDHYARYNDYFFGIIMSILIIGIIGGLIALYLIPPIFSRVGHIFGGSGQTRDVRTAWAWSGVPAIWNGILLVLSLAIFREELFLSETPYLDANAFLQMLSVVFSIVNIVIHIWSFVVFIQSLAEAHRYSIWRALGTALMVWSMGLVLAFCIGLVNGIISSISSS